MASYREMDAVGRDRARFVRMAKQCLAFPDIIEWERKFLNSLIRGNEMMGGPPEQLSLRQAAGESWLATDQAGFLEIEQPKQPASWEPG